jgi:ATP-dependent Clp protease ATP-binding subunit ClpC
MEFNLQQTGILQAVKRERFFLFAYAKTLAYCFAICFLLSLFFLGLSFLGLFSAITAIKILLLLGAGFLLFLHIALFSNFKIKNPKQGIDLQEAIANPDQYNIAELLSFESAQIAEAAAKFSKRRKIQLNSTTLMFASLEKNEKIASVCFRLGLDVKTLQADLKNYLEKMPKGAADAGAITEDFKNVILFALQLSADRKHTRIGAEELFCGLAEYDTFFKEVLLDRDLKKEDVQALTLWLDEMQESFEERRQFWTYENLMRSGSWGKDLATGYTITLDEYAVDFRKLVAKWGFKQIVGHQKEISEAETILARTQYANVMIIGEPGTGRKSIVEAIAQHCYLGTSLPELNNKRVVELDMVRLSAGVRDIKVLESTLDRIFAETVSAGNVILVIDELQNFMAQNVQKAGAFDVSGVLSKYLAMPSFQFIGITTYEGLHTHIEQNASFADMFRKVEVQEISEAETILVLQGAALEAEYRHKMLVMYPAIREIVHLTSKYMPSLPFPKKALDILDETIVFVETKKRNIVTPADVALIISQKTEIPVGKMDTKEKDVLLHLEDLIHQHIVNQSEAVKQISSAMRRARAGITTKKRPMGSFLFLGPTGVGKTETAKALALIYFGSEQKMIRIDMSEFQAITDIPRLIGAVSPVEMQGLLTTPVRETPFSLVLLDEVEKAHPNILNLFLQVLDEGHITDGQGRKVMFTNTIIICTSNAGADMIFKYAEAAKEIDKDALMDSLFEKGLFRPEFVNRFDAAVVFHPLTKENLMQIAELTLQGIKKGLKEKDIDFEITEALKAKIVELSYKPQYGAREMRRVVQDNVEESIANALLKEEIKKGDSIEVNPENFELIIHGVSQN